jgi:hypothetical protein
VIGSATSAEWTLDASHETIEMLVDPYGNRLQNSTSIEIEKGKIEDGTGESAYLVEACDPCEADKFAYAIQGIEVSDFLTPHFYDPVETPGPATSLPAGSTRHGRSCPLHLMGEPTDRRNAATTLGGPQQSTDDKESRVSSTRHEPAGVGGPRDV